MSAFIGREQDLTALHGYLQDALHGKGKVVFIIGEAGIGKTRLIEEFKAQHLDAHNVAMQSQKTSKVSKTFEVWDYGAWTLRGTLRDADMPIPTSVEKVIEKRVERLKEELQKTLKYASVNGEQFNTLVLAKLLNWDELELLEKLEALSRVHQLVKEIELAPGQTPRGAVYQFIHSLVQKFLYATLSAGIKSKLHANAAEILEEVYQDDLESVAAELIEHYSRGQNHAQAAKYALLAARKANRQSGFQEARTHAQHGLECLKTANPLLGGARGGSDQAMLKLQIELLIELATSEEAIGETKNSIDHVESAANLVKMSDEQNFQGEVFYRVGKILTLNKATDWNKILLYLEQALAIYIKIKAQEQIVNVLETMFEPYRALGKGEILIAHCQEITCLNCKEEEQHPRNIKILKLVAKIFYEQGKYCEAYQNILESLTVATKMENPIIQIDLLQTSVIYAIQLNDNTKAVEHYVNAKAIAEQLYESEDKDMIFYKLGDMAFFLGKYEEGIEYCERAKEIAHNKGDVELELIILSLLIYRTRDQRMFDKTLKYETERLEIRQKLGRVNEIMSDLKNIGLTFRHQGQYEKAIEMYQQTEALARKYERERSLCDCLITYSIELCMIGRFQEAITKISEANAISQKIKDTCQEIYTLSRLAISHFLLGHIEESLFNIDKAVALNQMTQSQATSIFLSLRHSYILTGVSKFKEAHVILETTVEEAMKRDTYSGDIHVYLINSAKLYLMFNESVKSLDRLQQTEEFFKRKISIGESIAMLKDAYAQVYLAQGELDKAETSLNEAIALFQQMRLRSFRIGEADLTLAALRLAQGQPDAALQAAADAHKIFQEIEYYRRGEAILWEAKSHFALRHFPETRASLAAANAIFTRQQQPHHAAEAKLVEGQLLLAELREQQEQETSKVSETFEVSRRLFTEAQATFAESGLKRLEKEAAQLITDFKSLQDF